MQTEILARSLLPRQLLTTADAARMLLITVHGVRWLARNGRLPYEATASGQRLFKVDDVVALLERRRQGRLTSVPADRVIAVARPRQLTLLRRPRR